MAIFYEVETRKLILELKDIEQPVVVDILMNLNYADLVKQVTQINGIKFIINGEVASDEETDAYIEYMYELAKNIEDSGSVEGDVWATY